MGFKIDVAYSEMSYLRSLLEREKLRLREQGVRSEAFHDPHFTDGTEDNCYTDPERITRLLNRCEGIEEACRTAMNIK